MNILAFIKYAILTAGTFSLFNLRSVGFSLTSPLFSDIQDWETIGDAQVTSPLATNPSFIPDVVEAVLTTAAVDRDDDYPARRGSFNVSGNSPVRSWGENSPLESFLGFSLFNLHENSIEGSALKKTFSVRPGDILKFDWNFLTNDFYEDYAFVSLGEVSKLVDSSQAVLNSPTRFQWETRFQSFAYTFERGGDWTVAIGIVDVNDSDVSSALVLENLQFIRSGSQQQTSVMEPCLLWGLGSVGLFLCKISRNKAPR